MKNIIFMLLLCLLTGCATLYGPDGEILAKSKSFGRDLVVERKWDPETGTLIYERFETRETVSSALGAGAELAGTLFNGATKLMP